MALNNVPLSGQNLLQTRDPIRNNFSFIDTGVAQDHQALNSGANSGMHNKISSLLQPSADITGYTMPASSFIIWNAIPNTASAATYPYTGATPEVNIFRTGAGHSVPMTASLQNANGWTYLPSGILLKWGTGTFTRNTRSAAINFPSGAGIPAFSAIYHVNAVQTFSGATSDGNLNVAISCGELTTASFKVFPRAIGLPSGSTVDILYFALGVGPV